MIVISLVLARLSTGTALDSSKSWFWRDLPNVENKGCGEFEEGCDYPGNDLVLHIDGMTKNKCSCGCYKEPKCNAWTYIENFRNGQNYCWFKTKAGSSQKYKGAFCGQKKLGRGGCGEFSADYDYMGNDIKSFETTTKNKCSCLCYQEEDCKLWLYIENFQGTGRNYCWFKSKAGPRTEYAGALAGHKIKSYGGVRYQLPDGTSVTNCERCPHYKECHGEADRVATSGWTRRRRSITGGRRPSADRMTMMGGAHRYATCWGK